MELVHARTVPSFVFIVGDGRVGIDRTHWRVEARIEEERPGEPRASAGFRTRCGVDR